MNRKRDNRNLIEGSYYHIINRGNWKENIAHDDDDFATYVAFMKYYFGKYKEKLVAYCMMPNHFHLIVQIVNSVDFVKAIKCFSMACARYYNKKYSKVGHIFQDKYKHRLITDELDLAYLSRYIHRNPLSLDSVNLANLAEYPYSSFGAYIGESEHEILHKSDIMALFRDADAYKSFVVFEDFKSQVRMFDQNQKVNEIFKNRFDVGSFV